MIFLQQSNKCHSIDDAIKSFSFCHSMRTIAWLRKKRCQNEFKPSITKYQIRSAVVSDICAKIHCFFPFSINCLKKYDDLYIVWNRWNTIPRFQYYQIRVMKCGTAQLDFKIIYFYFIFYFTPKMIIFH